MRWACIAVLAGCSFDPSGLAATSPVDAHVDADPCPASYAPIPGGEPGSQYRFVSSSVGWLAAEQDCEHDGRAHLAVLGNDGERDAVRGQFVGDAWMGVTDLVSQGTWFDVTTGLATYLPWDSGEPNDDGGNERCVELKGGGFNDEDCSEGNVYVCECDGLAANPVAYTTP